MTIYQSRMRLKEALAEASQIIRRQALSELVDELVEALSQQGYRLDDLLEALADHLDQQPNLAEATKLLEDAADEVRRVRDQLASMPRSDRAAR